MEKSEVWRYFKKVNNEQNVECNRCGKKLSHKDKSTSNMRKHLDCIHSIKLENTVAAIAQVSSSNNLDNYLKKRSIEEQISRLAAVDGLTIRQITQSEFIRNAFSDKRMKLPQSENTIMQIIRDHAKKCQELVKNHLAKLKIKKFSLTFDEWTSTMQRRYMNVNLHTTKHMFNLGLIRIKHKCDATVINDMITSKLEEFGLSWFDIVGVTCDGAAVNYKFFKDCAKSHEIEFQFCINHGTHLCVTDVFYQKRDSSSAKDSSTDEESTSDSNSITDRYRWL